MEVTNNITGMTSEMASHVYTDIYFPILQTPIDRLEIHSLQAVTRSLFGLVQGIDLNSVLALWP